MSITNAARRFEQRFDAKAERFIWHHPLLGSISIFVGMRFAAANVRELIFLKIAIEQKAVEYGLKGRIVVASSAFVYTNAYFALQNACWGHPKPFHSAPFRCRLRIPAERFLSGDALRVIEDLHQMGCRFI